MASPPGRKANPQGTSRPVAITPLPTSTGPAAFADLRPVLSGAGSSVAARSRACVVLCGSFSGVEGPVDEPPTSSAPQAAQVRAKVRASATVSAFAVWFGKAQPFFELS